MELSRNLLIRQPFDQKAENVFFAIRKTNGAGFILRRHGHQLPQIVFVDENLAFENFPDAAAEILRGMLFVKNSRNSCANHFQCFPVRKARGYQQYLSAESPTAESVHKLRS